MATPKNERPIHERGNESFGLLANGSCGQWEVAIDESTSGADRWFAQIEGPSVSFYFEIPSASIIGTMLQFFEVRPAATKQPPPGSGELNGSLDTGKDMLVIGKDKKNPITLVRDDEYPDRFFLLIGVMDSPIVRFVMAGTDAMEIAEALRQVKEDLDDED